MTPRFAIALLLPLAALIAPAGRNATLAADPPAGKTASAFTLDEALGQLRLYPKDAYLQYVALQLARRENRQADVAGEIERSAWAPRWNRRQGGREVDLFSIFTGALAVQESLQLDTMRGQQPVRGQPGGQPAQGAPGGAPQGPVDLASLAGPTIQSHPWAEMLAGKKPDIGKLARYVPEDFFFAEFGSLTKMLDVLDSGNLWSKHLLNQTAGEARSQQIGERLKRQLVVETDPVLRPFYDLVVEEVAVTGNDLFFNEGSDVTLLFRFKQPAVFKARMDGFLQAVQKADAGVTRQTGKSNRVDYVHLSNPERTVHVFSAYPEANLHVRSNSLPALERVLAAIRGSTADGEKVRRLGESSEFAYIRTLMPRGAKEEDGFVYLSDPFIRKLVGPGLKLTERRRVLCYNHLRMIGHASLMYRGETGRVPDSLAALDKARCSPGLFGRDELACPDGGEYSLSSDGAAGVCSLHGPCQELVPCIEHSIALVTAQEAAEYQAFVTAYNQYWRTFFDPIGIRIKVTPEQYRLETIILPLIDNSIYGGLAATLAGRPEPLDALPVPKRNIFSVNFRLDKEGLAEKAGLKATDPAVEAKLAGNNVSPAKTRQNFSQIGLAMHNYHSAHGAFPEQAVFDKQGKPLLSWRVQILPYLNEAQLYNEFRLDEPWDSEHNKKLIERMPAIYEGLAPPARKPGKTTYLAPVGKELMFTGDATRIEIAGVPDGTFNTIFIVQADDEHAVAWTKPEDLEVDLESPAEGLADYESGSPALFVDGSVGILRKGIESETLAAFFMRNDGRAVFAGEPNVIREQRRDDFLSSIGLGAELSEKLGVPRLLLAGIGNQVGLHSYDAPPLFDLNLPDLLGESLGSFNRNMALDNWFLPVGFLIASINAPVYVSIPVQDAAIVDEFLERLDAVFAARAREPGQRGWFELDPDFYRFSTANVPTIRCQSFGFGPVKFRVFWARIGTGLYIASKPFILDDLASAAANRDSGRPGHAMFKIRSRNWDQVLSDYRLGWAENNRRACMDNLGPLSSVARALAGADSSAQVCHCADRLHGLHFFCPEGGRYERSPDGKWVACSIHGTALEPRQRSAPTDEQPLAKLLSTFTGLEATLTFLDDGLHAVVTIDRK